MTIWVKQSERMLVELGFRPTSVSVTRKINDKFTMADGYVVPEKDAQDVVSLLAECSVPHEVESP